MSRIRRGFTLIELLIVVAIIAILAAIAVPNFLEAQTRSKVSRVKADIRALATGLEAYFVDHNFYPPSTNGPLGNGFGPTQTEVQYFAIPLSTPVSYMSSGMLPDPFGNEDFAYAEEAGFPTYYYVSAQENEIVPAFVVGQSDHYSFPGECGNNKEEAKMIYSHMWYTFSAGPDRLHEVQRLRTELGGPAGGGGEAYCILGKNFTCPGGGPGFYDPSNGTISRGDIWRTGKTSDPKPQNWAISNPQPCQP